jgi:hypothetical protein
MTYKNKKLFNKESVEFCKKTGDYENHKFDIIKYNKMNIISSDYDKVGFLRSMIIDQECNKIIAVGPKKSVSLDCFKKNASQYQYEEFIDGVMINMFRWNNTWEISTRSIVGANKRFSLNKTDMTFRDMFFDACRFLNINLENLPTHYCYSFVLQHPDNRIVKPIIDPELYLVEAYEIIYTTTEDVSNTIKTDQVLENINILNVHGEKEEEKNLHELAREIGIALPEKYKFKNYQEAIDTYASSTTDYKLVGVVIKDYTKNLRTKIRNPVYEEIKILKGNHSKKQYLYLVLRHSHQVSQYLQLYPEDKPEFSLFREHLHHYTDQLYKNYVSCFILKKKKVNDYPFEYKINMTKLHSLYLNTLLADKKSIMRHIVIDFVNKIPPKQQMFLLNYKYRTFVKDQVKLEQS